MAHPNQPYLSLIYDSIDSCGYFIHSTKHKTIFSPMEYRRAILPRRVVAIVLINFNQLINNENCRITTWYINYELQSGANRPPWWMNFKKLIILLAKSLSLSKERMFPFPIVTLIKICRFVHGEDMEADCRRRWERWRSRHLAAVKIFTGNGRIFAHGWKVFLMRLLLQIEVSGNSVYDFLQQMS